MHGGQLVCGLLLLLLNPQNCLTWRCCEADSCEADLANNSLMGSILYIAKSLVARTISISSIPAQIHSGYYTLSLQSSTFRYRSIRPFSGPFKITMKRFNTLLICFFALFWVCLAAPRPEKLKTKEHFDPDNFNMANEAAKTANVDLEHGGFYAFLEKWQSHNSAEECASGFSHVRLVVGQYMNKQRKTLEGNAYDLIKDPAPVPKKIYGAPWDENVEDFWANHYFKAADEKTPGDKDGWLKASKANSYTYGGKVKPGIVKEGSNAQK